MPSANEILPAFFLSDDPDVILGAAAALSELSSGRVCKPEGMNLRTGKPEREGLCCAKIFGPVEDLRCLCGKLHTPASAGEICDKCGVLCGESRLRGERWGHIEAPVPLLHPRLVPRIARLLGCTEREVMDRTRYETGLAKIEAAGGADEADEVWGARRIQRELGQWPELLLWAVPVTPPAWRGTRNDPQDQGYMALINRCNRLSRLMELSAPQIILDNEESMTQMRFERVCEMVRAELVARRSPGMIAPVTARSAALLQAVLDRPDDDQARAAYAEYLTAAGDHRGELISLQLAGASRSKMTKREGDLLRRNFDRWVAPLGEAIEGSVVFRRGFLASCKTNRDRAAALVGDPAWATLEHLDTDLVELITHPVMRGLQRLTLGFSTLRALCEQPRALPDIHAVNVAIRGCPPARWRPVVTGETLPGLRQLTVVHRSERGEEDWSWLTDSPLAQQLSELTVAISLERLATLSFAGWIDFVERHPDPLQLSLSLGTRSLVFHLKRRADGVVDLRVRFSRSLTQGVALGLVEIPQAMKTALTGIEPGRLASLTVESPGGWYGDDLRVVAEDLRWHFGAIARLPRVV